MAAAGAAAHYREGPRIVRGRPSGLKAAAHRLRRRPCGPALTPEPLRPLGGRSQGARQSLPPGHHAAPAPGMAAYG